MGVQLAGSISVSGPDAAAQGHAARWRTDLRQLGRTITAIPTLRRRRVRWGENSTDEMGSLLLNVLPKQAGDITLLQTASIVYVLTPVPLVGSKPLFVSSGIVDGASAQPGAVTPGKIVVLYGSRLGPATLAGASIGGDGKVATNAGGTQVLFDGVPAPILYTSSGQVAAVVPYAVDGKPGTQVQVRNGSLTSDTVAMPVFPAAPSIFSVDLSGTGQAAVLNQDGLTVNSAKSPAAKGSYISIYATGEGQTDPGGIDGSDRHRRQPAEARPSGSGLGGWQAGRSAIRGRGAQCGGGIVPGQRAHPAERLQRRRPHRNPGRHRPQPTRHDSRSQVGRASATKLARAPSGNPQGGRSAISALAERASTVSKPTCGRSTVFRAWKIGCFAGSGGSMSNTSIPAPARRF